MQTKTDVQGVPLSTVFVMSMYYYTECTQYEGACEMKITNNIDALHSAG
jgi:hypothetical protein